MMAVAFLVLRELTLIGAAVFLIYTDHAGWAAVCFLFLFLLIAQTFRKETK